MKFQGSGVFAVEGSLAALGWVSIDEHMNPLDQAKEAGKLQTNANKFKYS